MMEVIACRNYVGVMSLFHFLFLFLLLCTLYANAQPGGFLSIDCGGEINRTDNGTDITWVTDDNFIRNIGKKAESYYEDIDAFYLRRLRVFPKPLNKACYELPLTPKVPHLLRVSFVDANSTTSRGFNYSVETTDMLYMEKVVFDHSLVFRSENILMSADSVLYICLIRTSECDDPFISAIELRPLKKGMYDMAQPGTMLHEEERCDMGGEDMIRYPRDPFDRLWHPPDFSDIGTKTVNVSDSISGNNTKNFPPSSVMHTAVVSNTSDESNNVYFYLGESTSEKALVLLYFAELNSTGKRSFSVGINNVIRAKEIDLVGNFSAIELPFQYDGTAGATVNLQSTSRVSPIINAYEIYSLFTTQPPTFSDDVATLRELGKAFSLNEWISDPCFGLQWEGVICKKISNTIRVFELNLTGRQLWGPIPPSFKNLTELVSLSLNDNNFNGTLPNLTTLSKLETLHLQNNHLSDKIPDWLSKLPRLKEFFNGNKHLCRIKEKCRHHVTSIALGVAGGVIVTVILVGIIVMYRMKLKSTCTQPNPLDYLMVNIANSSKSRAFTLEEMTTATENFTHKIGQGSFGTVFLGKLQEGKQIAVKVLSVFNKHGIEQFSNEVDLLSKINHKKLVSFLGYCICNESRDLMLVYEYMSGGSLSDNLYDPHAPKYPQLDWRTRLKIALDAAQGLEYLHVGCTPKIIHRDVKTSNILLDSNLNGKLADFGLSRVTGNDETSQINTTIKGTPGYLDPMYYRTHMLTDKSDVYSFGVVLLELICGRKPIDVNVSAEKILLTEWVAGIDKDDGNIQEMVDKRLGNRYNMKSITHSANLAWRCIASDPSGRPAISEVVVEIKEALAFEEEYYQGPDELSVSLASTSSFPTYP